MNILKFAFLAVIFCNVAVDISHKILLQNIAFKIFDGSSQVVFISIINSLILLPFLMLFSISGFISDKYDKKNILVYGALSSLLLSIFMVIAYALSSFYLAMFGLFLLAVQSAIYSPAKFGIIISIYKKENLSKGNSFVQAISMIAILFTMGFFSYIFEDIYISNAYDLITSKDELLNKFLPLTYYIVLIAFVEFLISFLLLKKITTNFKTDETIVFNKKEYFKAKMLKNNLSFLKSNQIIFLSVIAISIFWGISQGLLAVFPAYAKEYLNITNVFVINAVLAASGIGIALGSFLYSRWSKNYIETGTIPLAALGLALSIYFAINVQATFSLIICFFFFGTFGGLFVVPLNSLIQFNSKFDKLGTVLAGANWFQSLFMFFVLILTTTVSYNGLDTKSTLYILLIITIFAAFYTLKKLPLSMVHFFVKFVVGLKYKLEVTGMKNIPSSGGLLLLGNHVSWIDWAIIQMATPREIKFVMEKSIYNKWYLKWFLKFFHVIPIATSSSKSTIQTVAKELDKGSVVVLFPEGNITRNGHLGEFKKGFELILKHTTSDVPVIAFYIRGLWESMFSRANKKFIDSYRTNTVTVSFSSIIKKDLAKADLIKHKVMDLTIESWSEHIKILESIPNEIFNKMKEVKNNLIVADSTGMELSGTKFLTVSILFKNLLKNKIKGQNIGLLVPSTAAGAFINTSILMLGRTAVNLNYTADLESLYKCLESAEIKTIVASKKFLEKLKDRGMDLSSLLQNVEVLYLEDLKLEISKIKALCTLLSVKFFPISLLKFMHIKKVDISSNALIMFSSGSEGNPKGIELTHMNILGNTQQIASILNVNDRDAIVGSLPLFHAFGICVTTFLPLIEGIKMVAHPDPTDGYEIGKLVNKYKATIMCGTSTFFRLYTINKKVHPLVFESLRYVVAGAEKLSTKVREDFKNKFGKEILEGYGTTETSPVASCNLPDILTSQLELQRGNKLGTVGMPLPGTSIKIVDPQTMESLALNEEGMVLIGGVQIMKGYLNNTAKTNSVIKNIDGKSWYITGDKGKLDNDGFLTIVDRYSRFAKLAGEMVSLGTIEAKLFKIILNDEIEYVVSSIPDEKKGEKIVLLLTNVNDEYINKLKTILIKEFENKLIIPSLIKIVNEIPKLGSGKIDYGKAKILALS